MAKVLLNIVFLAVDFNTRIDKINDPLINSSGVELYVKRDDLIHPYVSGNKLYKLKYNIEDAIAKGHTTILTFGGAYSNHLVATAAYCKEVGLKCIGIVRGSPLPNPPPLGEGTYAYKNLGAPLLFCLEQGMLLHFISREEYRLKKTPEFIQKLEGQFDPFYLIPEGGYNALGVKGAAEILNGVEGFDVITCACGTGTTLAGLVLSAPAKGEVLGFSVLKGPNTLTPEVAQYVGSKTNWNINNDYHLGGYAKTTPELLEFITRFLKINNITLDKVYTSKLFFALYDLINKGYFPANTKLLAIHTGGYSFS